VLRPRDIAAFVLHMDEELPTIHVHLLYRYYTYVQY